MRLAWVMIVALAVASAFDVGAAKADHLDPFVQITCIPEMNYFSLHTFHIWDTNTWNPGDLPNATKDRIHANGFYEIDEFVKEDRNCKLATGTTIIVHTAKYYPGDRGKCYENNADLEVSHDDKVIKRFKAFTGSCNMFDTEMEYHQITDGGPFGGAQSYLHTFLDAVCEEHGRESMCAK